MSDDRPIVQPADLIAPWLADLKPYAFEDVSGLIKLDAMENPYAFPSELKHSWLERLSAVEINRYPDPHASELKVALHRQLDLPAQANIVVGNGSDELIHMLCLAFNRPGAKVLTPAPSFAVYPLAVERELKKWPEMKKRQRRWYAPRDAARLVDEPDLAELIENFAHGPREIAA